MRFFLRLSQSRPIVASPIGWVCFQTGLFFLAASPFISGLFFLISLIQGSFNRSDSYLKDKWNYPLIIAGTLMVIGCFKAYSGWLAWIGLANWLPMFWSFWAFQPYVLTPQARKRAAFCFVAGTFPVLLTGFGQLWFGWSGPWELFDGLIIWFVDSGGNPDGRLSGLFNYANITGSWLALVWPFSLTFLIQSPNSFRNRLVSLFFTIGVVIALFLTDSRNAWLGMVIATPLALGPSNWIWLLPFLIIIASLITIAAFPLVPIQWQSFVRNFVPESLWGRLNDMQYMEGRPLEATRLYQWKEAINLSFARPLLGYGAAAFSVLYPLRQGLWHGHAHNLPLELTVAHGLPVAVFLVGVVLALLIRSFKTCLYCQSGTNRTLNDKNSFDRAWWTATFVLVVLHGTDMPLFDSRLNIAGWILLAGLRCLNMTSTSSLRRLPQSSFADV